MKGLLLFLLAGGILGCASQNPEPTPIIDNGIKAGFSAIVPEVKWVKDLRVGRECHLDVGGVITVTKSAGTKLQVVYESPFKDTGGTQCPSYTYYEENPNEFQTMTDRFTQNREAMMKDQALVKNLLDQNYYGAILDAGSWHWIKVVNPEPVFSGYKFWSYGEMCGIGRSYDQQGKIVDPGGTIQERSKGNGKKLYEYATDERHGGTPCSSGVLFWQ